MASKNPQLISGADPTVLKSIETQSPSVAIKTPPNISRTTGATTSAPTTIARGITPITVDNVTTYPQSVQSSSAQSVAISTSINNDSADIVTVYETDKTISVSSVNQTVNTYKVTNITGNVGVSQIIAGNNITITSTGSNGTGNVTINSTVPTVGNIAILNLDGNASNVLHGDGTWSADQTTYGNSNVAAYLPTYTGNVGANVVTANLFAGSGANLTSIAGANVSGFVPNANVANTAFAVAAANVSGLGNIATINLTGSTSNVLYGNGVFAPASGGGNVSELVNGDNSFVLDSAGNVVFEGTPSGNAVDRGLVWDYGANANGVNSMIRQDLNGLTVRAWTEDSGNYTAPVNIITGQDANAKTWRFDGQGNLTVPSGSINSISDAGSLGAYITLTPDLGFAQIAGREAESNVGYTTADWTSASYTGTQVDFVDSPQLVDFFNTNRFNVGVNQTISINGDEPVPFTGYSTGASNAVTVYTSVTASPDPTTVTSINFYYQLESYVNIDYDAGTLNVNASGLTINIDNDQTSGPDINIRSGDDILLQAKDKAIGTESEGGDINIYAGDGADDDGAGNIASTGGDIQITAGNGGDGNSSSGSAGGFTQIYGGTGGAAGVTSTAGSGGYVSINGGDGGYDNGNTQLGAGGGYVSINAGLSTQEGVNGPNVTITSGQGGPNALAGSVVISTPASVDGAGGTWTFDGYGNLTLPNNSNIATIGNVTQFNTCSNGFLGLNSYDAGGNNIASIAINSIDGLVGISTYDPITDSDYHWAFDTTGNLTLPGNTFSVNYANGTPVSIGGSGNTGNVTFDNVTVQGVNGLNLSAGSDFTANLAYLQVRAGDVASHIHLDTGNNEAYDQYFGNDSKFVKLGLGIAGNVSIGTYQDGGVGQFEWTFDSNGNLILAGGNSIIQSIANSSLDPLNPNVSTMVLTPSASYSSQALVLDPTAPGHIHLRAPGANIDEPSANIFLGGETSSFEVGYYNGAAPNLFIHSANNTWTFDTTGDLTVPGNLVYIGASPAPSISGFNSVSAEEFTNDTSNVTINANSNTWNFDSTGNLTIPSTSGGFIKTAANASIGIVAMDNGTNNPAQLLSMNVGNGNATSIVSAYSTNVAIQTNASGAINTWKFDNAGNLTLPANTFAINYANGTQVSFSGSNISNGNSNVTIATSAGNVVTNVNAQTILTVYSGGIKVGGSGVLQSPGGATAVTLNNNGANLPIANITNTLNVTGAAGANITSNLVVGGTVTSTGKIGYSVGGNATQSSTGAGVTINQLTGLVTLANRTYNAGDLEAFSISCNKVSNDDFVLVQMVDSVNAPSYNVVAYPNFVLANTISVLVKTLETVGTDTPILKFMIVKAPTA